MFPGTKREKGIYLCILLLYLLWVVFFIGLRTDHVILAGLVSLLFFAHPVSQKFVIAFGFFLLYWVLFDSLRVFPNYDFNQVHISDLYQHELNWFGIPTIEGLKTPSEYFGAHHCTIIDVLCGTAYLFWVPAPILFTMYCFFKKKEITLKYWIAFLVANLIGFTGYYLYPAAPPWYHELYGTQFIADTSSYAARLLRLDHLLGIHLFENMYSKGSAVFAAIPSMHAAFPVLLFYYSLKLGKHWLSFVFLCLTLGIWFGAVYFNHHYIIDVILGILCAIVTLVLLEKWLFKSILKSYINHTLERIL